jgi:hypothetical protein
MVTKAVRLNSHVSSCRCDHLAGSWCVTGATHPNLGPGSGRLAALIMMATG